MKPFVCTYQLALLIGSATTCLLTGYALRRVAEAQSSGDSSLIWPSFLLLQLITEPLLKLSARIHVPAALALHLSRRLYNGSIDCASKLVKAEGPGSLFKGLPPALLRQSTYGSLRYGLYGPIRNSLGAPHLQEQNVLACAAYFQTKRHMQAPCSLFPLRSRREAWDPRERDPNLEETCRWQRRRQQHRLMEWVKHPLTLSVGIGTGKPQSSCNLQGDQMLHKPSAASASAASGSLSPCPQHPTAQPNVPGPALPPMPTLNSCSNARTNVRTNASTNRMVHIGAVSSAVANPTDLVKVRLQTDGQIKGARVEPNP